MEQGTRIVDEEGAIDPIFTPSALRSPSQMMKQQQFDALNQPSVIFKGKVDKKPKSAAIILAGGQGERFGREGGKQIVDIEGVPVLTWSIHTFDAVGDIGLIVVVCPEERTEEYRRHAIDPYNFATPIVYAPSGYLRQESAFSGLEYVPDEYEFVVLHDGARPMITPDLVEHSLNTLKGNIDADGVVVGHPTIDTLKVVENGIVVGTPDRTVFWNAQTPQAFRTSIYRRAHASALSDGFVGTDDSSLIERMGGLVLMVEGKRDNIKLTTPEDIMIISAAVRQAHMKDQ